MDMKEQDNNIAQQSYYEICNNIYNIISLLLHNCEAQYNLH